MIERRKATAKFLCLLVCLFVLTGCDRSAKDRDKAIAEAEQAKAELARVETALEETQSERDELKENLAAVSENWGKANSELTAVTQAHDDLLDQINKLTNERDTAVAEAKDFEAMVKKLTEQLQDKIKEVYEYEQWSKNYKQLSKTLKTKLRTLSLSLRPKTWWTKCWS